MIITVEYNNVIRVTGEVKINLMTWWSINIVDIYIQEMLADFTYFLIKPLVRVINKHYGCSVKESSLSPPGGFHIQELALSILRSPATGGIKP